MERILSSELSAHIGEHVLIAGWLHHQRPLSKLTFVLVRDRAGITQIVASGEAAAQFAALLPETVVSVEGRVVASAQAPAGVELVEPTLTVISVPVGAPTIALAAPVLQESLPTILDHAATGLRHPRAQATFAISAASVAGFRAALDAAGFTEIMSPKLVGGATESGASVFKVDYFGAEAYLAQSPQFYKQTMVGVFERVYETAPVFRAEPHDTVRHLAEYVSLDAEMGFITDYHEVMAMAREAVAGMLAGVGARAPEAVKLLGLTLPTVPAVIPEIDFVVAQGMIEAATGEKVVGEPDLAPAHERWLGEWAQANYGSDFLFVTGYPMSKRPFYTAPQAGRSAYSASFDLLFRGLELITGGQRLHRYEDYLAALSARGMTSVGLEGYLEAFAAGMPPHGGFAIGLERWTARLTGAANIRETTLFPRDRHRLTP